MKNLYLAVLFCVCSTADAQKASYLSFNLASPVLYGEAGMSYFSFSGNRVSWGISAGYMQRLNNTYDAGFTTNLSAVRSWFLAGNGRYYIRKVSNPLNIFVGINLVSNGTRVYYHYYSPSDYGIYGFNISAGLRFSLGKRLALEPGLTIPGMAARMPGYKQYPDNTFTAGLGNINKWQNSEFRTSRIPLLGLNLFVKLN